MKISAAILCVLLSASAFARDTIVFGIISYDTPLSSISNQTLLVRYIEQKADIAVRVITLKNDEETVNAFKNGIVDIAWIGTYQYMKYRTQLFAYPLVKPVHFGRSYYRSLFVTHRDSGIQTLSDLSGKTVAFVSSQSEAGYIYPVVMLAQNRMYEGEQYYARFLKGHDNVLYEVYSRKYEAGCVFDSAIDVFLNSTQRSEIRILATSRDIPYEPVILSKRINDDLADRLRQVLIECDDESLLDSLDIQRFTEASLDEYTVYPSRSFFLIDEEKTDARSERYPRVPLSMHTRPHPGR